MLKELQTQHREIARLKFAGCKAAEIATRTNTPITTVRNILSDPICKAYISKLNDAADVEVISVRKRLIQMNSMSLNAIEEILNPINGVSPSVVLAAAKDNLDRTGHQIVQKHQNISVHLTKDDINDIKQRAINAGACIPEAEYQEVM